MRGHTFILVFSWWNPALWRCITDPYISTDSTWGWKCLEIANSEFKGNTLLHFNTDKKYSITTRIKRDINGAVPLISSNWAVIVFRGTQPSHILNQLFRSCQEEHSLRWPIYMQIHTLSYFSIMKCLKLFRRVKMRWDNWQSREEANLWITLYRKWCTETHPARGSGIRQISGSQYINRHMECV